METEHKVIEINSIEELREILESCGEDLIVTITVEGKTDE